MWVGVRVVRNGSRAEGAWTNGAGGEGEAPLGVEVEDCFGDLGLVRRCLGIAVAANRGFECY